MWTCEKNTFITNDLHGAITASSLAYYYGAEIRIFEIKETDRNNLNKEDPFSGMRAHR